MHAISKNSPLPRRVCDRECASCTSEFPSAAVRQHHRCRRDGINGELVKARMISDADAEAAVAVETISCRDPE